MKTAEIHSIRATNDEQIVQLVAELERQSKVRKDYVVPGKFLSSTVQDNEVMFGFPVIEGMAPTMFEPTKRAHETLRYRFDIAKSYYERMGDVAPDLLAYNINYWAERETKNYLVRTLDDKVRAIMSDRFRTLDNVELFFTAFQTVKDVGARIVQADLTEDNFYMKILHPEWAEKVTNFRTDITQRRDNRGGGGSLYRVLDNLEEDGGQWLVPGLVMSNSDVGAGSLHAELFVFDTICWNGMVYNRTLHQVHLGKQLDVGFLSQETRELEDKAIWSHVKDMIHAGFDKDNFLETVKKMQGAVSEELDNPVVAVDTVVKNFGFSDDDKQSILNELISAGSNTVYGLLTAVTAVGRDKNNQDETIRFERAGGDILEDPREFVRVKRNTKSARR